MRTPLTRLASATGIAVLATVMLTACGSSSKSATPATTTSTSGATTSSTAAATTTSTTSPKLSASSKLTLDGLGGLTAGTPVAAAAATAGVTINEVNGGVDGDSCLVGNITGGPAGIGVLTEKHVIQRVDVFNDSKVSTLSGIHIGSTEADVMRTYPSAKTEPHEYVQGGHYLIYSNPSTPNRALLMETDGKVVTAMRSGRSDFVGYVEGCA